MDMGFSLGSSSAVQAAVKDYTVMIMKFPGWNPAAGKGGGPFPNNVWGVIPANRIPLIGAYDEAAQGPCDYVLSVLRDHGIDIINIECYFKDDGTGTNSVVPDLDHFLPVYLASKVPNKPKFCLTWCCETNLTAHKVSNWPQVYQWMFKYFADPNYARVDGKPMACMIGMQAWRTITGGGAAAAAALNQSRAAAVAAGFGGIHWIGFHPDSANFWKTEAVASGWDGVCSYTVFSKTQNGGDAVATSKTGYAVLDDGVVGNEEVIGGQTYHSWMGNAGYSNPPVFPAPALAQNGWPSTALNHVIAPIMTGWDDRPWNPANSLFAIPTDAEFEAHCIKVRSVVDAYRSKTKGFVSICALDEFGEGQFVLPTPGNGSSRLKIIKRVFGGG